MPREDDMKARNNREVTLQLLLNDKIALDPEIVYQKSKNVIILTTLSEDSSIFQISGLFADLLQVIVLSDGGALQDLSKVIASFPREQYRTLTPTQDIQSAILTFFNFLLKEKFLNSDLNFEEVEDNIKLENKNFFAEIKKIEIDSFNLPTIPFGEDGELVAFGHYLAGTPCGSHWVSCHAPSSA